MKAIVLSLGLLISFGTEAQNTVKQPASSNDVKSTYVEQGNRVKVTHYHQNGAVRETGFFKNEVPDGKWETFSENGTKTSEINYRNGARHGEFRVWDNFSDSYMEVNYADGKMVSANRWVKEAGFADVK